MLPDEPTEEERAEELPEDNETPFRPAAPSQGDPATTDPLARPPQDDLPDDHPTTDTNIQREELYDEGISGAAEAAEPQAGQPPSQAYPLEPENEERDSSEKG
jgi:hypothetical protein